MTEREAFAADVRAAQSGDTRAFDALVKCFQNRAIAYARSLLRDPTAAEDAAQEALVQAWRDLPMLGEPLAFAGWLRRIVFKHCDRARRTQRETVPLNETIRAPRDAEPAAWAEQAEHRRTIHAALERLPAPLHAVTLLYYMTGHNVREIADFLGLTPQTVKNRLHAARKRLRKELWEMAETVIEGEKPSLSEDFSAGVLARVVREYQWQKWSDPHAANRDLLREGREAMTRIVAGDAAISWQTARDGFALLWEQWEFAPMTSLLMRFLAEPRTDGQTAWAYLHLANALALGGSSAGAVLAHEAFERLLAGKTYRLSRQWPHDPSDDSATEAYNADEVRLLFLCSPGGLSRSYHGVWRLRDYEQKLDAALSALTPTESNREQRFYALRAGVVTCQFAQDFPGAEHYLARIFQLAAEPGGTGGEKWQIKALGEAMELARVTGDSERFARLGDESARLLTTAAAAVPNAPWLSGERHNVAYELTMAGQHEAALPLWEANEASGGQANGGAWLLYAATVWKVTGDRSRTVALLREAAVHSESDLLPVFKERPEFASVLNDADFLAAIRRP